MLAVIVCLAGIFGILVISEILWKHKILEGEYLRKFVHILSGIFIAFWPWLISWQAIQFISLAMLAVVIYNHRSKIIHMSGDISRHTYGGILFPIAVIAVAQLTHIKIFFAIAILHLALADGLAAVIGTAYGKKMTYRVFHQVKTVLGSMAFWFTSLCILSVGILFAQNLISFSSYALILIILPPILAVLENLAVMGLDNLVVPVAAIIILRLAT